MELRPDSFQFRNDTLPLSPLIDHCGHSYFKGSLAEADADRRASSDLGVNIRSGTEEWESGPPVLELKACGCVA